MDKNTYETYEYLPVNDNGDANNFFVVQDDGTFFINRQVQYVAQIENVKEVLDGVQSCRVYDVTPQQLLVDVDNSTELISVSDQFVLPEGDSNLYTNNYLVQPGTSSSTDQMEENVAVDHYKQLDPLSNMDITQNVKQSTNCTEITLNDEQYKMLEEKGWILLETNDRIYLLDTLGLHDITTNYKLINKLKTENQNNFDENTENNRSTLNNVHNLTNDSIPNKEPTNTNIASDSLVANQDSVENGPFVRHNNDEMTFNQENHDTSDAILTDTKLENVELKKEEILEQDNTTQVLVIENDDIRREGNTLKIKTKLCLKNFPDKIVLGKTLNGKQLVARVVKPQIDHHNSMEIDKHEPEDPHMEVTNYRKWEIEKNPPAIHLSNLLNEAEFLLLIQHLLENNINNCCVDDIVSAESVISQLLQIPTFKSTVTESYLVITKTVQNEESLEKSLNKGLSAVVTGKVSEENSKFGFVHLPHMLQNMINLCTFPKNENGKVSDVSKQNIDVLHVQILESKQSETNNIKVSVTVNKRSIPMDLIAKIHKQLPKRVYACSACAALFETEDKLKEHQVNNCLEPDDVLTIDMDEMTKTTAYCVVNEGKAKSYACMQCNAKFNKLNACKSHLKTHVPKAQDNGVGERKNKLNEVYKCNMCPCTYFHPSTLSKHILSRHIKMKS